MSKSIWEKLVSKMPATKRQRRALHRLRRSAYVPPLSTDLARQAIELEIKIIAEQKDTEDKRVSG